MIQPTPTKPSVPTFRGPSSHSPLPIEIPREIRLGPRTNFTTSLRPRWGTPKTSSGSGRSTTGNGSRAPMGSDASCGNACCSNAQKRGMARFCGVYTARRGGGGQTTLV
jgi:hypothetical protein